jgi:hypothetical protein
MISSRRNRCKIFPVYITLKIEKCPTKSDYRKESRITGRPSGNRESSACEIPGDYGFPFPRPAIKCYYLEDTVSSVCGNE